MRATAAKSRKMRAHQIVEFFGLPGSGKTTAAYTLLESNNSRAGPLSLSVAQLPDTGKLQRILFKSLLIIQHPLVSAVALRETIRMLPYVLPGHIGGYASCVFNLMYVSSLLHAKHIDQHMILDQGVFQGCWAMLRVLKPEYRTMLRIENLFTNAFSEIPGERIQLVHVPCDGHEARRRAMTRLDRITGNYNNSEDCIQQDETCMTLMIRFSERLLAHGKIGSRLNWEHAQREIPLRSIGLEES